MFLVHWKDNYFKNWFSSFWKSYEMCKRIAFLNDCSHKMNKFLIQHKKSCFSLASFPISILAVRQQWSGDYLSWAKFIFYLFLAVWQQQILTSTCPGLNLAHHW